MKKRERERKNMSDALRLFVLCKIQYRQRGVPAFAIANGTTTNNNITVWVEQTILLMSKTSCKDKKHIKLMTFMYIVGYLAYKRFL